MRKVGVAIGAIGGVLSVLFVAFITDLGGIRSVSVGAIEGAISTPNENLQAGLLNPSLFSRAARNLTEVETLAVRDADELTRLSGATRPASGEARIPKLVEDVDTTVKNPTGKSEMSSEARKQFTGRVCKLVLHLMAQEQQGSGSRPSDTDIRSFAQISGLTDREQTLIENNLRSIRDPLWKAKSEDTLDPDVLQKLGEAGCELSP